MKLPEEPLRVMIDTVPTLAWICRPDGTTEFLNKQWLEYTGLSMEEALDWGWKASIHPDDLDRLLDTWLRILASEKPGQEEARLRRSDGDYRWFVFRAVPVRDEQGNIARWYGTNTDIEELKRAESLLSAEKSTLEMITRGADLKDILTNLCDSMDAQAPNIISSVLLMDPDGQHLRPGAGRRVPRRWAEFITPVKIGPCVGTCGTAAFLKKQVIVSDIATDPLWADFREDAMGNGLHAAWSHPIISSDNEVLGTFCTYYPEPRTPGPSDIQLIEGAAHIALIAIERDRSRSALKLAEDRHEGDQRQIRRIIDAIPQYISVLGPDGAVLYANEAVLAYTGLTDEQFRTGEFYSRIFHAEDVAKVQLEVRKGLERGISFELEHRALRRDGQSRWFMHRYKPLRDEKGQIVRWYVTGVDIDDHKRAEERMQNENLALREEIDRDSMFEEIVGSSEVLRSVLRQVAKVAPTDSTVLILGETGTGKELIARAIHKRSGRSARAFIRVNCAAIPPSLIASELFGHEKGAFTGALQRHPGRFESANGGTIFLDEIGDLPVEAQVALLRVLQEREFERVGSNVPISVDVRVVAATNGDLGAAVADGTFRQDLFYRLNVFPIQLPPLRARTDDIPLLVEYLVERYGGKIGKRIRNISKKTLELFSAYDWPGNVRELQNVIERAVILCDGETFSVDETWLTRQALNQSGPTVPLVAKLVEREKEMIEAALAECHGRVGGPIGAAAKLGIPRQTLESKITKLGINRYRYKTA